MTTFILKYKYHLLLIIIGLSILTVINGLLHLNVQSLIYPDSVSYYEAAKNVYIYQIGHNYRPMIMAAINGIPYLFGCSDAFVYEFSFYVNVFCWLSTALVLFEILKTFVSEKIAFIFSLCSFLFVGTVVLIYHLLTENIYTLFIALAFYFLLKFYKTQSFWTLSLALSILIISMLVRPGSKWLAIVFMLFFIKELLKNYKSKAALLIYGSWLLIVIQCVGINYQFGNFTISYIDSVTYYNYIGSKANAHKNGKEFDMAKDPRTHYIFSLTPPQIQEEAKRDLIAQLENNKIHLLYAYCSDVYDNTFSGSTPLNDCKNVNNTANFNFWKQFLFRISQWQNILFTFLGLLVSAYYFLHYKTAPYFSLIAVYVLYIVGSSGISCSQGDRFHLVIFPFVLVLLAKFYESKVESQKLRLSK